MTKKEAVRRTRDIVANLRLMSSWSRSVGDDVASLEYELAELEADLARQIDDYQAGLYARHNFARGAWTARRIVA